MQGALALVLQGQLPPGWPDQGASHSDNPQHGQQRRVQAGGVCVHWCASSSTCDLVNCLHSCSGGLRNFMMCL